MNTELKMRLLTVEEFEACEEAIQRVECEAGWWWLAPDKCTGVAGGVDKYGVPYVLTEGMNLMFELSVQEAKPLPDFTGTDDYFVSVTLEGLIIDKAMLSVIKRISVSCLEGMATIDFLVIDALYHERNLTEKMKLRLPRLTEMGIIEHIGRKRYVLARSLYAASGKTGVHTRRIGLDRETNKELLLKHIHKNNNVGTPFNELQQVLPGHNRSRIQVLLREMRDSGKIYCEGKTSDAKWFAVE